MALQFALRSLPVLLASLASAQNTIDNLSFGHKGAVASDGQHVPGFRGQGINHELRVLSDRVILTPPVPGNAKGALWSEGKTTSSDWSASLDFRASGQEVGSGNLQLWYTKDQDKVGTHSVYNVEQFDGLVLVVDQYGGTGGKIRGFLNDGTQNFRAHSAPESLAFGHCDYRYRNLGRPSKLTVKSSQSGLEVKIDDRTCFSTSSVALPEGYHFGITASTGESNPDQIEVYKFQVSSNSGQQIRGNVNQAQDSGNQAQNSGNQPQSSPNKGTHKLDAFPGIVEAVPDRNAEDFKSQTEQFSDLHNRMQAMSHHIGNVFVELKTLAENSELQHKSVLDKHAEMIDAVSNMKASRDTGLPPETIRQIKDLSERVARMEASMAAVERSLERGNFEQLHHAVNSMGGLHETLPQHIKDALLSHGPRLGTLAVIVVGFQLVLAAAYVVYKRRRNGMPKKFL